MDLNSTIPLAIAAAAKMDDGAPWHKGVLQGAEKFMASWHKEEEEASRRRATKRDSRDLEPPTHL